MSNIIYQETKQEIARVIIESGSYLIKDEKYFANKEDWFEWKSGIKSPTYTNCRHLMGCAKSTSIIVDSLVQSIKKSFPKVELIIGIEAAGIHWSSIVASRMNLPTAFIRKQAKSHGADQGLFVGKPIYLNNVKAVIVDDLIASGASIEKSIKEIKSNGKIEIIGIQSIVNWEFPVSIKRFKCLKIDTRALVGYNSILQESFQRGDISFKMHNELISFYKNPQEYQIKSNL
jgi:orotate phosphoribosyltransferase